MAFNDPPKTLTCLPFQQKNCATKNATLRNARVSFDFFFSVRLCSRRKFRTRERGKTTFETLPILEIPPSHAALPILLMEDIRRSPVEVLVVCPTIHREFYFTGGAGFLPSTVPLELRCVCVCVCVCVSWSSKNHVLKAMKPWKCSSSSNLSDRTIPLHATML